VSASRGIVQRRGKSDCTVAITTRQISPGRERERERERENFINTAGSFRPILRINLAFFRPLSPFKTVTSLCVEDSTDTICIDSQFGRKISI